MPAPDLSTRLLNDNQGTIEDFLSFVWKTENDYKNPSLQQKIFDLYEYDEEMSGIRSNYDYGQWMESLDPFERGRGHLCAARRAFWFGMFGMRCGFAVGEIIAYIVRLRRVRNGDPVWEITTNIGGGIGFLVPFVFIMWRIIKYFIGILPI